MKIVAPTLTDGRYPDCPPPRGDDWTGRTAAAAPAPAELVTLSGAGEAGLACEPLPPRSRKRVRAHAPEQLDLLGTGDDDGAPLLDPVLAADGLNQSHGRGHSDLLPKF